MMKKTIGKKVVSVLLSTAMLAGVLAGCGSDNGGKSGDKGTNGDTNASGLEHVTLHFLFYGDKKSATDEVWDEIAEYTKDKLNADFDVQFIAGDDYKQKLNVKAATGDSWDMNFDSNWTGYFQMVAKDAYMNLDELLPKYAPDLYKAYQEKGVLQAATNKGHIVALPWTMKMNNRPFFQWRGDLAEKAGLDVDPNSITDLASVDKLLYQLKEAYPDKQIIETAEVSSDGWNGWSCVDTDLGLYFRLDDPDCKIVQAEDIPEWNEMAKYAEKWQSDGIISKDILNNKVDANSLINQGKLITKWGTHEFATQDRAWVEPDARWDYHEVYNDSLFANRTPLANAMCIPATSENPERTLMFLNMVETDQKLYDLVQYGIEGKTYVLNGEEAAYPDGMDSASSNYMEWGGQWALWKPQFMRPNASYSDGFWEKEEEYADSSDKNVVSPLDGFSFDASDVTTQVAQRNQIYGDAKKLIVVGLAGDPEKAIDKCKADSQSAGFDEVIKEFQKQVDDYLASSK